MSGLSPQRVVVLGAGALGSYIGAKLSSELPVRLVGRRTHVEAVREAGLRVTGLEDFTARLEATEDLGELPAGTLVVLTVKLYDLDGAAAELEGALAPGGLVLPVMNGLHPEKALGERLGPERPVVRGVAMLGVTLEAPGHVSCWGGGIRLEPSEHSAGLCALLSSSGIPGEVAEDYEDLVWRKFAVNCVWNPLTAVLGVRNSLITEPELADIRRRVIEECEAVARADGVEFPGDFRSVTDTSLSGSENISSMLQDITGRPRTENELLSGELVRRASRGGLAAPASELLRDLVEFIELTPVGERARHFDSPPGAGRAPAGR